VLDTCFSGRTDDNNLIFKDVAPVSLMQQSGISPPPDPRLTVLTGGGPTISPTHCVRVGIACSPTTS